MSVRASGLVIAATAILIGAGSAGDIPRDAPNQPPFPLSSLQERCDDQTGAALLAGVEPEYHFALRARSDIDLPSQIPLTIRIAYRGGALTCYPAIVPPEGSTRPQIAAQVGVVIDAQFLTEGGAFDEQFDMEIKGRSGGVNFSYSTTPDKLRGTYRPDLPGYEDVSVGFVGYFGGDLTNGSVLESGIPPGHVSELIPVAQWATYLDQTPVPASTPMQAPTAAPALPDLVEAGLVTYDLPSSSACITRVPTASICVANIGSAAAGPFSVSGTNGGAHYDFPHFDGLRAGEHRCSEAFYSPLDAEVLVTVDSNNEVEESNEDNNTRWEFISFPPFPTCTPAPTPTPPLSFPPLCIGDCNGDGTVTVGELIIGVNMALGSALPDTCAAFCFTGCAPGPGFTLPNVACLTRGVNYALDGCPASCATDEDCDPGNPCAVRQCTPGGCLYECACY